MTTTPLDSLSLVKNSGESVASSPPPSGQMMGREIHLSSPEAIHKTTGFRPFFKAAAASKRIVGTALATTALLSIIGVSCFIPTAFPHKDHPNFVNPETQKLYQNGDPLYVFNPKTQKHEPHESIKVYAYTGHHLNVFKRHAVKNHPETGHPVSAIMHGLPLWCGPFDVASAYGQSPGKAIGLVTYQPHATGVTPRSFDNSSSGPFDSVTAARGTAISPEGQKTLNVKVMQITPFEDIAHVPGYIAAVQRMYREAQENGFKHVGGELTAAVKNFLKHPPIV